jgi:hypothetical protein
VRHGAAATNSSTNSIREGCGSECNSEGWPLPSVFTAGSSALPNVQLLHDLVLSEITKAAGAARQQQAVWQLQPPPIAATHTA